MKESRKNGSSVVPARMKKKPYGKELLRLHGQLVEMQEWVKASGTRLVVIFEGRDAAGQGGAIKRVAEYLDPAGLSHRGSARTNGAAAYPVVLPALHRAPAGPGRATPRILLTLHDRARP